jgi:hypothetical protein
MGAQKRYFCRLNPFWAPFKRESLKDWDCLGCLRLIQVCFGQQQACFPGSGVSTSLIQQGSQDLFRFGRSANEDARFGPVDSVRQSSGWLTTAQPVPSHL